MRVTAIKVRLPDVAGSSDGGERLLAFVTVELDGVLALSHVRVIQTERGRVVAWPSVRGSPMHPDRRMRQAGYVDVAYPTTDALRTHLRQEVLAAVERHLAETP
jgi:DNA-binding cell septation regulator SpoVG